MKSHVLLLAVLSIVFPSVFLSANPTPALAGAEFQRLFGNSLDNRFNKVIRLNDDYYLLGTDEPTEGATPHATLTKLNPQGQLQWTIRLTVPSVWNDIIVTDEGNLLLVGGTAPYDASANSIIGVATTSGSFLWVNYYNFANRELLTKVVRHPNPLDPAFPYYILGVTQQPNSSTNDDINLVNIDANGVVNFRKIIGNNADEEFYRDLEVLGNGNFLLVGHAGSTGVAVQVNTSGSVVTGSSYSVGMRIYDSTERPGSGFYLAGSSSPASPAQISRVDGNLQPVWSRTISQLSFLNRIWVGPDQAIYALGYGNINGINRNMVVKIVETNNIPAIQWSKHLDAGDTTYLNGNIFFLSPDQIAYVDGRTGNTSGFGKSDAFLSISSLDLETCITQPGPALSLTTYNLQSSAYSSAPTTGSVPTPQPIPILGIAWQQIALCGSSCEPVNSNTFSTILDQQLATQESELAVEGFQASNGEYVTLGLSTAFSTFSLDLIFTRMDDQGNLLGSPKQLDFEYNGEFLENFVDGENISLNAHLTEAFDPNGQSQGYFLAATMFSVNGALSPDGLCALIDHSGCIVWSRFVERPLTDEYVRDVVQLPGSDLAVLIYRADVSTGENIMELLRLSLNGQECNSLLYTLPSTDDFYPSVIANVDGLPNPAATVAVGGYRVFGQRYLGVYLLQSDLTLATPGPLLFDILPANGEETPIPTGLVQDDQNLVIAGYLKKNSPDREAFLMEVRPFTPTGQVDGTTLWARRIRVNGANSLFLKGYEIFSLDRDETTGNLFAAGSATGANDSFFRGFMLKSNSQGLVQWVHLFPGAFDGEPADNSLAFDLDIAGDGSLLVTGYRPRPDSSDGFHWVALTDPNGNFSNCECFDPMTLQVENFQPQFSQTTSPEPTPGQCSGGITIPACLSYNPAQLFCDQYSPQAICEALFEWQPNGECGEIGFTNQSTGTVPVYLWEFGDPLNSTSTEENPVITYFSSGDYIVCLTITTPGCTDTFCDTVTVDIAGEPATLLCPPDIAIDVDPGACENTVYQLPEAAVVDNCPCDPLLDVTYPMGYDGPYAVGPNAFTVTAVDACGIVTCDVTVTVDDGEGPVITCPADTIIQYGTPVDPSVAGEATATDLCGAVALTYTDELISSGECETVTQRTWIATDLSGNTASCVQTIGVQDLTPLELVCPDNIVVEADSLTCTAILDALDVQLVDDCISQSTLVIAYTLSGATVGSGSGFPIQVVPFEVGITEVEITISESPGEEVSCTFSVEVLPADLSAQFDAQMVQGCGNTWSFIPEVIDPDFQYSWDFGDGDTSQLAQPVHTYTADGFYTVTLVVSSGSGCQASAQDVAEVLVPFLPIVSYEIECLSVAFLGVPDDPSFTWTWDLPGGQQQGSVVMATFPGFGTYEVCATVTDGMCTQTICQTLDLNDTEGPVLSCPGEHITTDPGFCTATYSPLPGAQDNCTDPADLEYIGTRFDGQPLNAPWPLGSTCVTWMVSDDAGNTSLCVQCITVADEEPPVITCPENETVTADSGAVAAIVNFGSTTASDYCSGVDLSCSHDSGTEFPIGITGVVCTATDDAGNVGECSFLVTVLAFGADSCCVDSLGFVENVAAGFSWVQTGDCEYSFTPNQLNGCQQVTEWQWGDGAVTTGPFAGNTTVGHIFAGGGDYEICMSVSEVDEGTGEVCWEGQYCETISFSCGVFCDLAWLQVRTGYDYGNGVPYPDSGAVDAYWLEFDGVPMETANEVAGMPHLPGSAWVVPLVSEGYRDHRIEFSFCLPLGAFDCQDLVFDLGIQAWALAEIRINGRPVSDPVFGSPAYGVTGNWLFQPELEDCGLFRNGENRLTIDLKTVHGGGGLNVAGSISSAGGNPVLGAAGCCPPAPECSCSDFEPEYFGIEVSPLFEGNPCYRAFRPMGVEQCDEMEWLINSNLVATSSGDDWVYLELPGGDATVCMLLQRTDLDGNDCGLIEKCIHLDVECGGEIACENGVTLNPELEGTSGILGEDGDADPWLPAFGAPFVSDGPGAADPGFIVVSGNADTSDCFYQIIEPEVGKTYELSLNVKRYLPARPGEDTRVIVRLSDVPQTSPECTGNCHTLGMLNQFSDTVWYHYTYSFLAFDEDLKYLSVLVENDFGDDGSPVSRSIIQVDNICLDFPSSVHETARYENILLYPNPSKDLMSLVLPAPVMEVLHLTLYDLWGRPVKRLTLPQGQNRFEISLEQLPPAVYWLEIRSENGAIWREKAVKVN